MIKKLMIILFITLNQCIFSSQFLDKESYDKSCYVQKVPSESLPLLFTFVPQTKTTKIYALTQSWVQVDSCLVLSARNAIEFVTCQVLQKINNGTFKQFAQGNSCSYALIFDAVGDDWHVQEYDPQNAHKNYFLQHVIDVLFQESIESVKPRATTKLPPLSNKGMHAKK